LTVSNKGFISNNIIKIIAVITMVIDHVGVAFYPTFLSESTYLVFRAIGRIAMPLFAFLIAEGCRHTKDKKKYFTLIFLLGIVCDIAYFVAMEELYLCILTTFSFSILFIYSFDGMIKSIKEKDGNFFLNLVYFASTFSVLVLLSSWVEKKGGTLDYGILGALLPLLCYLFKNKWLTLIPLSLGILALSLDYGYSGFAFPVQWFAFLAVPIVALYNGKRGKYNLKYFFYLFYPVHLLLIEGIYLLLVMGM